MSKGHRLERRKQAPVSKPLPLNWLLGCTQADLDEFELARLAEVSDLRSELHAILDRVIDSMSQAALASWFKAQDRNTLKSAIENEESPEEWAARMIRDGQRSAEELIPRSALEPGVAHRAASLLYQKRNMAEGKCSVCPKPLDPNSVRFCTEHLTASRHRHEKKGKAAPGSREYLYSEELQQSEHGRTPGTLASLAMNREKKTRALLTELGVKPEHAAVSLGAAKEALLKIMPDRKHAMTQTELFKKARVITKTTGQKALDALLHERQIQRIGNGGPLEPYRYFREEVFGRSLDEPVGELPPRAGRSWK